MTLFDPKKIDPKQPLIILPIDESFKTFAELLTDDKQSFQHFGSTILQQKVKTDIQVKKRKKKKAEKLNSFIDISDTSSESDFLEKEESLDKQSSIPLHSEKLATSSIQRESKCKNEKIDNNLIKRKRKRIKKSSNRMKKDRSISNSSLSSLSSTSISSTTSVKNDSEKYSESEKSNNSMKIRKHKTDFALGHKQRTTSRHRHRSKRLFNRKIPLFHSLTDEAKPDMNPNIEENEAIKKKFELFNEIDLSKCPTTENFVFPKLLYFE